MKPAVKFIFCFLCFFLDVHVRAEEHGICNAPPCAIKAEHNRSVKNPAAMIAAGGTAEWRGDSLHLVKGTFLLQGPGKFSTAYATLSCEDECLAIVERDDKQVILRNLHGDWRVDRLGDKQTYAVPPAMQVRVAAVSVDGQAEMDFPQSLPWLQTIKTWGRLFQGSREEFKEKVSEFREVWEQAVEAVSDLHGRTAERAIASHNEELAKAAARRAAIEREDAQLRQMFREKNNLSP
ncbi:MAG: hypothetical protein KF799_12710 [Bdellovibrionales bacterium]|nr:hypothetical protein [Bdellovibrionales bacterium]